MKKTRSTKRALLMSVLALVMCVSMLIGSTFAWFTDSVTSSGNKIVAGTLKIDLELKDAKTDAWASVKDASDPIFNYLNWEPGYTDVKILKVENEGTLALKWVAKFVSQNELSELADVIDVYVCPSATELNYPTDRSLAGYKHVGTVAEFVNTIEETTYGTLEANEVAYLGIALKMQESADNKYQGMDLGGTFDIQILATQFTSEDDSFDDQYDKDSVYADAYVTNVADLAAALAEGGTVALMEDLTIDNTNAITINKGAEAVLNLNGHKIVATSELSSGNQAAFKVLGDLSVVGTGLVSAEHKGANMGWGNLVAAFSVEGGSLTLGEGVIVSHKGGSDMAYAVDVNSTIGTTTLNVEGAIVSSPYTAVRLFNNHKTAQAIVNYKAGYLDGAKRDIWVQNPSASAVDANGVVNIADGLIYTMSVQTTSYNSRIYQFDTSVVSNSADFKTAVAAGEKVVLTGDVTFNSKVNKDAAIELNGNTFEATGTIELGSNADLTMNGGAYEVNSTYGHVDVRPSSAEGSTVLFEDVDFSFNKLNVTNGPSTNRLGSVVEVCATATDAHTVIVFKNCTFDNAQVLFEGMSGKTGSFEATFENCTFNALTSSAPIYVQNYVKGTINVINCTFNLTVTSSTASAISVSPSSSTAVTVNAKDNTINAEAATPYTYDAAKGEDATYNVKVNGTPANIKFISSYSNTTLNVTGTTATGIAVAG